MSFTIKKEEVITYPPEELWDYEVERYEWIDNLHFLMDPKEFLGEKVEPYIEIVRKRFAEEYWHGDGDIGLLWIPPFLIKEEHSLYSTKGLILWHAKQLEDGLSYLLLPPGSSEYFYPD